MAVIMSRRYRRHRYHKTKLRNPRKTSKTDKGVIGIKMMQLLGNLRHGNRNAVRRAEDWMFEIDDCFMCGTYIVEMANIACCQRCFEMWIFLDDDRKCQVCGLPLKDILNRSQVDTLCDLVKLKKKKMTINGHYTEELVKYRIFRNAELQIAKSRSL